MLHVCCWLFDFSHKSFQVTNACEWILTAKVIKITSCLTEYFMSFMSMAFWEFGISCNLYNKPEFMEWIHLRSEMCFCLCVNMVLGEEQYNNVILSFTSFVWYIYFVPGAVAQSDVGSNGDKEVTGLILRLAPFSHFNNTTTFMLLLCLIYLFYLLFSML